MKWFKGKYYKIKNWLLIYMQKRPLLFTVLIFLLLIGFFNFCLISWQSSLNSIVIELIGSILTIVFINYFIIRNNSRASYPITKQYIYSSATGVLTNISNDILFNYLNVKNISKENISKALVPDKKFLKKGVEFLSFYTKEENRELIENKYTKFEDGELSIWQQRIKEYRFRLGYFLKSASLIKVKDEDFVYIYRLDKFLHELELEFLKKKDTRIKNKKLFSSLICGICSIIIETIDSGLYNHFIHPKHITTVMKRSN